MGAASRRRFGGLLELFLSGLTCLEPMAMAVYLAGAESEALDRERNRGAGDLKGPEPMGLIRPLPERPQVLRRLG